MRGHSPQNGGIAATATPMPIYAFACNNCGHLFDKLQKLSDPDPDACPACGAAGTVHRRLTAPLRSTKRCPRTHRQRCAIYSS